jgi:hypothetical protein
MGHAASAHLETAAGRVPGARNDPQIQKGLGYLAEYIGEPAIGPNPDLRMVNLYSLWSVERVGVMYDLKTIGGKDWYRWGAQILLANQQLDGAWSGLHYHGSTPHLDTCFALLFLKRSNLVQDLTDHLRLYMPIRDTGSEGAKSVR